MHADLSLALTCLRSARSVSAATRAEIATTVDIESVKATGEIDEIDADLALAVEKITKVQRRLDSITEGTLR
jgi:hypothetical protein